MRPAALVDRPPCESVSHPNESGVSASQVVGTAIILGEELAALGGAVGVAGEGEDSFARLAALPSSSTQRFFTDVMKTQAHEQSSDKELGAGPRSTRARH